MSFLFLKVALVCDAYPIHLPFQVSDGGVGQHGQAIFVPFAFSDRQLVLGKVHVLNAQPQTFEKSQSAAVKQQSDRRLGKIIDDKMMIRWRSQRGVIILPPIILPSANTTAIDCQRQLTF